MDLDERALASMDEPSGVASVPSQSGEGEALEGTKKKKKRTHASSSSKSSSRKKKGADGSEESAMSTASDATAVLSPRKQKTHRGKDQGEERRRKSSKKKSRSIRWKHLTDDVLSVVFSYLTIQDLSVTRVNHQFRSLYYQNVQRVDFLSRFSARRCSQWADGDLRESVLRFSSLRYLSLDSCAKLTNETLQLLCERFQGTLEALLLGSCSLISERGLAQVASLPSLRSLSISGCSGLTAVGIERVLDTLPLLQRLDVSFLPQVTDRALIAVECMTNLLSLDLGCTRVTGAILELVPLTLRELRLSGCPLNLRTEILFNHGQGTSPG